MKTRDQEDRMEPKASFTTEQVQEALQIRDFQFLRKAFLENEVADIAEIFSHLPLPEAIVSFRLVARSLRVEVFSKLELEKQEELLEELPDVIVSPLLNEMEPDDRTHLIERVQPEIRQQILSTLNPKERQVARKLLSYPEGSVGRLMTPDILVLNGNMTVAGALDLIRWTKALPHDYLNYLFICDDQGVLIGEVSLAELVISDPQTRSISHIMKKNSVVLAPDEEATEAVEIFRKYDRNYIPVVDQEKKIIGIVTSDDVFDVAEEEATEDLQQFGGQDALEDSYFQTPTFTMIKKRLGWLAVLFVCGFFSCQALQSYEGTLEQAIFLMFFLPIVTSVGGNSGTQAASLIIRGLAIKEMTLRDAWPVLRREIVTGLVLGLTLSLLGFAFVFILGMGSVVGLIVAVSVISVVLLGVVAGSMLPFVFEKFKLDPAVVSSPFISTLLDVTGIIIYINVAISMMQHFQ